MDRHLLAWSGGKDAAFALHRMHEQGTHVSELWTTINEATDRSSMHGVRSQLYRRQAQAIEIPIRLTALPEEVDNETYRELVREEFSRYRNRGFHTVSYADVALDDVRQYREMTLEPVELEGRWPIWGIDTGELAKTIIETGLVAMVVAIDGDALDSSFLGRRVTESFLDDLPPGVDPAGEGGEYHTFVTDGPMFDEPLEIETGRTVERTLGDTTMHYLDLSHSQ